VKNSSVTVKDLSKQFEKNFVLKNISFSLDRKGIFGILGKNGAGKTTLLGMLMGLITPSSGEIFILEKDLRIKKNEILKEINFQSPYVELPKKMTVMQNFIFYSRLYGLSNYLSIISKFSEELKIVDLLDKSFGSLSSGQKTRVSLCKALINKPKLLLLDEPTASLDPETSMFVRNYLINYQEENNSSILLTSHNLQEIEKMCSYIIILREGEIVENGDISDLLNKNNYSSIQELFLGEG